MLDPLEQHNQICWIVLDDVWWRLTLLKLFIEHRPTFSFAWSKYAIISCLVLKSNIIGCSWIRLNTPASNTIQHWSNTVQHHLTKLDNVWPTCLIRLNGPLVAARLHVKFTYHQKRTQSAHQIWQARNQHPAPSWSHTLCPQEMPWPKEQY